MQKILTYSHAIIISIKNISCEFVMCTILIRLQRPFNFFLKKVWEESFSFSFSFSCLTFRIDLYAEKSDRTKNALIIIY
jgi:hypothetical protein